MGVFSERDIKERVAAKGLDTSIPVKEVMTRDPPTVDIDMEVKEVTKTMTKQRTKYVLVREEGEIVGILSFGDLIGMERRKLETYISRE